MNKHAALAIAIAAIVSVPAFAEGGAPVSSGTGIYVNSAYGVQVTPGVPTASVTVLPSSSVALSTVPGNRLLPGAASVQSSSTTVLGGPAADGVSGSKTITTSYWVNVPAGVDHRGDFQRWQGLK